MTDTDCRLCVCGGGGGGGGWEDLVNSRTFSPLINEENIFQSKSTMYNIELIRLDFFFTFGC